VGIKKERIKHKFQEGKKTSISKSGRKQRELEIVILVNEDIVDFDVHGNIGKGGIE